ncbi:MAG: MoaD/ThiS family protein [Bacteroidales bacterium]|nr:MoaD/ThiS family protein [Bacteroidales bacterium]MDT8373684.1 MoaD/ThiS family protein [Bacteroidales bacterium]
MATQVKVLYFGAAQQVAGKASEDFTAEDTASLREQILERYPAMRRVTFRLALNRNLLKEESLLKENDMIAILPPFEGG